MNVKLCCIQVNQIAECNWEITILDELGREFFIHTHTEECKCDGLTYALRLAHLYQLPLKIMEGENNPLP